MSIITRCTNGICVCILPLERNDFRPLALRHRSLAVVSTLLLLVKVLSLSVVALTPATAQLSTITSARITELTNAERTKVGLPALTTNNALAAAAAGKAKDMLDQDYFAHISPSGVTPWFWMSKEGYAYQVAGENLAIDFIEAESVVAAWIASPGHKANLLHNSYTEGGIAVATGEFQGGTSTVVVHMFGLPSGATTPAAAPAPTKAPTPVAAAAQATTTPVPSATPTPTTTPTPTGTPIATPVPDTTPPQTPRISPEVERVQTVALLTINGERNSTVHILINNQERVLIQISENTTLNQSVDVSGLPDGIVTFRAYATDNAKNVSVLSDPISVIKDTTAPISSEDTIYGILAPSTDWPRIALFVSDAEIKSGVILSGDDTASFTATSPTFINPLAATTLVLRDHTDNESAERTLQLLPAYQQEADTGFMNSPSRLSRGTRIIGAVTFIIILLLLSLAIIIRFSQQRVGLITHASFVLFLALIIFLW